MWCGGVFYKSEKCVIVLCVLCDGWVGWCWLIKVWFCWFMLIWWCIMWWFLEWCEIFRSTRWCWWRCWDIFWVCDWFCCCEICVIVVLMCNLWLLFGCCKEICCLWCVWRWSRSIAEVFRGFSVFVLFLLLLCVCLIFFWDYIFWVLCWLLSLGIMICVCFLLVILFCWFCSRVVRCIIWLIVCSILKLYLIVLLFCCWCILWVVVCMVLLVLCLVSFWMWCGCFGREFLWLIVLIEFFLWGFWC